MEIIEDTKELKLLGLEWKSFMLPGGRESSIRALMHEVRQRDYFLLGVADVIVDKFSLRRLSLFLGNFCLPVGLIIKSCTIIPAI